MLQTAVDPIVIIDTDGSIVEVNAATTTLFGYRPDELIGHNVSMLMPEPYRSLHDEYISRYLREGDPRIIGIGREVEAQRKDGTVFPMSLAVSEVRTERDHLFTGIIHDLTERNAQRDALAVANTVLEAHVAERTERLESLLAEVQRSNRDLEHFAYIASHDLQAPLRNVRQGLELLDEHLMATVGSSFDDEAHELRDLVVAAVARMEALIKGLLEYSRVHRNPKEDQVVIDLNVLVGELIELLRDEVAAVGGTIDASNLPTVVAHPLQMRQVFQNLVENALRYRSAQRPLHIAIGTRSEPAEPAMEVIEVRDNGTGIDQAHHDRIFELFRRAHSGYDGVGLGLAICRRIVEGHGGRMWVESATDEGAAFCFSLPSL